MGKITGFWMVPLLSQVIDGPLQVGRIPKNDGGGEQVQTARAMALVFIGAVKDLAEPIEKYGAAEHVLLLALIESNVAATPQFGVLKPLQREQRSFQYFEFTQRERPTILPGIGRKFS